MSEYDLPDDVLGEMDGHRDEPEPNDDYSDQQHYTLAENCRERTDSAFVVGVRCRTCTEAVEVEPGACDDSSCQVLHDDPARPIHPLFGADGAITHVAIGNEKITYDEYLRRQRAAEESVMEVSKTATIKVEAGLRVSTLARWLDTVPADATLSFDVRDTADDRFGAGPHFQAVGIVATWTEDLP